ncbi:hypothetical protein TNCV_355071 [Trichonephila clavipes]|uniref:Uncharacterized protein n=1 Tax=Trichonephila clavipes TaxID=2585209 RepID=A0A8X7BBQ6_TRICX|nr:hypothetical protein TNCV_355071 [Trichonephila clavipes]
MLPDPVRQVGLLHDRWRHHLSPPPQFRHGTGLEGNILQCPCAHMCVDSGSLVVKVSDHGWHDKSSSPVPLKTHSVGTLNLSRAQTSSHWCAEVVVVRREGANSGVVVVL